MLGMGEEFKYQDSCMSNTKELRVRETVCYTVHGLGYKSNSTGLHIVVFIRKAHKTNRKGVFGGLDTCVRNVEMVGSGRTLKA